jgi:hypothetical protein
MNKGKQCQLSNQLYGKMSLPVLAAHCVRELNTYLRGEPYTDRYGVELIRRATVQGDPGRCLGDR